MDSNALERFQRLYRNRHKYIRQYDRTTRIPRKDQSGIEDKDLFYLNRVLAPETNMRLFSPGKISKYELFLEVARQWEIFLEKKNDI